jgi:hypothetical protein
MSLPFEEILYLEMENRLLFILSPLSCDKMYIYKTLVKHSDLIRNNHYLVTIDKEDNPDQINYDEFAKYQNQFDNKFFFIDNINFFMYYNIDCYNKNNALIFLINIMDIDKIPYTYNRDKYKPKIIYPPIICIDVNITYRKIKSYIIKEHLTHYKNAYLEYIKEGKSILKRDNLPADILNIYYDKVISSLENINLEMALSRSPKFKNLFLEIILRNKKRHLVHLKDNRCGMASFIELYNKLNTGIPLIIIKSKDEYDIKIKNLNEFNKNNSPAVLLTDFYFVGKNVPKVVNFYHITDGGQDEDIIAIFDYIKVSNKNADKDFEIVNHVATTLKGELTINDINELSFKEKFDTLISNYNLAKTTASKLYLKEGKFEIEV